MADQNVSKRLSIEDIYLLIYNPDKFTLTLDNMSDTYRLTKNLLELFKM